MGPRRDLSLLLCTPDGEGVKEEAEEETGSPIRGVGVGAGVR